MIMVLDQCGYAYTMCGRAKNHSQWLTAMRFGLTALVDQQDVISELVFEEACKLSQISGLKPWQEIAKIMEELGLKIVLGGNVL